MYERLIQRAKLVSAIAPQGAQEAGDIIGNIIDRYAAAPAQPQGITAYTAIKDSAGVYQSAVLGIATGKATGSPTAQSLTYKVQSGNAGDGSDMADIPASAYIDSDGSSAAAQAITADDTSKYIGVNLAGCGRYVRVVAALAFTDGTAPSQFVSAFMALGDGNGNPVS